MPYLKIQTNQVIDDAKRQALLAKASQLVAKELHKPEQSVMVTAEPVTAMVFAGKPEPAAFLDLRAIGLPASKTGDLSRVLCELIKAELGIPADRVFINFTDFPPDKWGWNADTF